MKTFVCVAIATSMLAITSAVCAEPYKESKPQHNMFGLQLDAGVPDGVAFGFIARPHWYWLKTGLSITHNGMVPGVRMGIQLDPIKFPIRLTLNSELGYYGEGDPSRLAGRNLPTVQYAYANLHGGLEFGSWDGFNFFIHAGPSWVSFSTKNFNQVVNDANVSVSDPHGTLTVLPTVKIGFNLLFL